MSSDIPKNNKKKNKNKNKKKKINDGDELDRKAVLIKTRHSQSKDALLTVSQYLKTVFETNGICNLIEVVRFQDGYAPNIIWYLYYIYIDLS